MLISSLILFAAGLILALSAALFVKISEINPFSIEQKIKIIENKSLSLTDILSVSPESNYMKKLSTKAFSKIDLNSYAGDLVICAGEETRLELNETNTNNLVYEIVGETLTVREEDPVGFFGIYIDEKGFSFQGLRQIFGPGNSANAGKTVTLYLSPDAIPEQIQINSVIGDVVLDGVFADQIHISSFLGSITVRNLANPDGKVTITGDRTDIHLENNIYTSCNASTKLGTIHTFIPSTENTCSTVLDVWMGKVFVKTTDHSSLFKISLKTDFGSVSKNGVDLGKTCNEPSETSGRITANVLLGNIDYQSEKTQTDSSASLTETDNQDPLQNPTEDTSADPTEQQNENLASAA